MNIGERKGVLQRPGTLSPPLKQGWEGELKVMQRRKHKAIVQVLLSAYFWDKVQARCSPSECRFCPHSS